MSEETPICHRCGKFYPDGPCFVLPDTGAIICPACAADLQAERPYTIVADDVGGEEPKDGYSITRAAPGLSCRCRAGCHAGALAGRCLNAAVFTVQLVLDQGQPVTTKPFDLCRPCLDYGLSHPAQSEVGH